MSLVINLFGGPGTGKSTMMAGLFCELKNRGVNCEMAPEYAKDKVWEQSYRVLDNQIYVFGKQHHAIWRLLGQVDVIITDSPILLSLHYGNEESHTFHQLVMEEHYKLDTFNVFLRRVKEFNPSGRLQNEEEARTIDKILQDLLGNHGIEHMTFDAVGSTIPMLADLTQYRLANARQAT